MKYLQSHPWITFEANLKALPYDYWMNLGAIQSKCKHIANVLLPPDITDNLNRFSLIKGVQATTAIEGNTLTEEQIGEILDGQANIPKSKDYQRIEVENIIAACNKVSESTPEASLTFEDICEYNRTVLDRLDLYDGVVAGEIPQHNVVVGDYRGAPRAECEHLVRRLCKWIDEIAPPSEDMTVAFAVIRAMLFHLYFVWIHPFGDGNGRTARLVELRILLGAGLPKPTTHLLSNHYNETRAEYYRQLDRSYKRGGEVGPFLRYAAQGFMDGLDRQIDEINTYQFKVSWKDFVYGKFHNKKGVAAMRQRQVALDLWGSRAPVEKTRIRTLTTKVAAMYGNKSSVTVSRDLKQLDRMNVIAIIDDFVWVNFNTILEMQRKNRPYSKHTS